MSGWTWPTPPYYPVFDRQPLTINELVAGPFGLALLIPLIPLILLVGRRWPRATLITTALVWLVVTLGPAGAAVLLGWLVVATGWVVLAHRLRTEAGLSERGMVALVWLGLCALILPLWWQMEWWWYPGRLPAFHLAGFAYFLLRMIAWGVEWARSPDVALRLSDTICWLLYPPSMRLGPFLRRDAFLLHFDAWKQGRPSQWRAGCARFGWFLLGAVGFIVVARQIPLIERGVTVFEHPEVFRTDKLFRALYLIPVHTYLALWTYNQLARAVAYWIGIPVPDNFNMLPLSTCVRDFWRRWNISVGSWLRDYIYIPLGGNRRWATLNIAMAFAFCGIWHGAAWSFLAWGLTQAAAIHVERRWQRYRDRSAWTRRLSGPAWLAFCWLLTFHYQILTIVVFWDYEHFGLRLVGEIWRRVGVEA